MGDVLPLAKIQLLDLLDDGRLRRLEVDRHSRDPDAFAEEHLELVDFLLAPVISRAFQLGGPPAHVSSGLCRISISHHGKFLLVSGDLP